MAYRRQFGLITVNFKNTNQVKPMEQPMILVLIKSILSGYLGFLIFHSIGSYYFYSHTSYVRQRLSYESSINFNRLQIIKDNDFKLYEEYPFKEKTPFLFSDFVIRNNLQYKKKK
jgi:hypothetical protein